MRRAFTLVEILCVVALTAVLMGTIVLVFSFCSLQTTNAYSQTTLWTQLNNAADRIELTIRESDSCSAQSSGTAIQCAMPNSGTDLNQDGQWDVYNPSGVNTTGVATYTVGGYVWYYTSTDPSGKYGISGSSVPTLWRAVPKTSANPASSDVDTSFSNYYSGPLQYSLVNGLSVSVSASARTVTFTLTANSANGQVAQASSLSSNMTRTLSISRTVAWRN